MKTIIDGENGALDYICLQIIQHRIFIVLSCLQQQIIEIQQLAAPAGNSVHLSAGILKELAISTDYIYR